MSPARQSPVRRALLAELTRGDGYGLGLIEAVNGGTSGVRLHQGNVYVALRDMEREGLLESYEGPPLPSRGGRPRRYYRMTDAGRKAAGQ